MCSCGKTKLFKKITHCIFDLDGTLLDTECVYTQVISSILKDYGKEHTAEGRLQILGSTSEDTCKIIAKFYNLSVPWKDILAEYTKRCAAVLPNCSLLPGANKLVLHLHNNGVPIAIATSSRQETMELKTNHLSEFFSMFLHIVAGGTDPEVKKGKPSPDIFLVCASRFPDKPEPQMCLVFEDAPNGAQGAIAAGMQCVIIPDLVIPKEICQHATLILNSLEDFMPEQFGLPAF